MTRTELELLELDLELDTLLELLELLELELELLTLVSEDPGTNPRDNSEDPGTNPRDNEGTWLVSNLPRGVSAT